MEREIFISITRFVFVIITTADTRPLAPMKMTAQSSNVPIVFILCASPPRVVSKSRAFFLVLGVLSLSRNKLGEEYSCGRSFLFAQISIRQPNWPLRLRRKTRFIFCCHGK